MIRLSRVVLQGILYITINIFAFHAWSDPGQPFMAAPEDIKLEGSVRKVSMNSSIGPVELRWARKAEELFGRTPERAVADSMSTVSRALMKGHFPTSLRNQINEWKIVFMDEHVPEAQIPTQLVTNCHPAWMTPPANIYVVAQRVAAGCGGGSVQKNAADEMLTKVMLHEIGHVIEFHLLKGNMGFDRARAEGFATWFAAYASDESSILKSGEVKGEDFNLARASLASGAVGPVFSGTASDYVVASLPFHIIVKLRGTTALLDVYSKMADEHESLGGAVKRVLSWDDRKMEGEMRKLLGL